MDAGKMSEALYDKMSAEQEDLRNWLLTQPPEEILIYAYAYAMREDILTAMKEVNLSEKEAAALLESTHPLGDVCQALREAAPHMDIVREFIKEQAAAQMESFRRITRSISIYRETAEYAIKNGEMDLWKISQETNIACKDAIETAISEGYDGMRLTADAKDILAEFGPERVSFVLAHTLQVKSYDARFSRDNVAWAKTVPVVEEGFHRGQYTVSSHPGLLNIFVDLARREMEQIAEKQNQRKPSIKEQLAARPAPGDRPDKPKDKGAR